MTPADDALAGPRILVVDDDAAITDAVSTLLRYEGFEVATAATGRAAMAEARDRAPDVIVLDVMLPDLDGFDVARRLRANGVRAPVLFLTARGGAPDKLDGLALGDDYVTKPFAGAEVIARVRALHRRTALPETGEPAGRHRIGTLELSDDPPQVWQDGQEVALTTTEFRLLRLFVVNAGRVLPKEQIMDFVWHYDFGGDSNILEAYVLRLRRKLRLGGPLLLHTVRHVGYGLRDTTLDAPRDQA